MITSNSIHPPTQSSSIFLTSLKNYLTTKKLKIKNWLDSIEIKNLRFAQIICYLIPASCPFERRIKVRGRTLLYIPPLCHINPFFDNIIALRFRALIFIDEHQAKFNQIQSPRCNRDEDYPRKNQRTPQRTRLRTQPSQTRTKKE